MIIVVLTLMTHSITEPKEFIYKGIHSCILLRFLVYYFVTTIVDVDKLYTTMHSTQNLYTTMYTIIL